jgi:hypothetical protein
MARSPLLTSRRCKSRAARVAQVVLYPSGHPIGVQLMTIQIHLSQLVIQLTGVHCKDSYYGHGLPVYFICSACLVYLAPLGSCRCIESSYLLVDIPRICWLVYGFISSWSCEYRLSYIRDSIVCKK